MSLGVGEERVRGGECGPGGGDGALSSEDLSSKYGIRVHVGEEVAVLNLRVRGSGGACER
jgi:hypothetical protein